MSIDLLIKWMSDEGLKRAFVKIAIFSPDRRIVNQNCVKGTGQSIRLTPENILRYAPELDTPVLQRVANRVLILTPAYFNEKRLQRE